MATGNISVDVPSQKVCITITKSEMKPFPDPHALSEVIDTVDSGGNSICWYGQTVAEYDIVSRHYTGNAACFCNTDLCNIGSSLCASLFSLIITFLFHLWK